MMSEHMDLYWFRFALMVFFWVRFGWIMLTL